MSVLDGVKSASDLKQLNIEQLKTLSEEIRQEILEVTLKNGDILPVSKSRATAVKEAYLWSKS